MSNNSINNIQALLNFYRASSSQISNLSPEITHLIANGSRYSLQQLDSVYDLAHENTHVFMYWCSLLLIRLSTDSPVTTGNSLKYLKCILDFAEYASNYTDIILLEYAKPLNIEIAESDPTHLCLWANELYQRTNVDSLRSPITHLVARLKIESYFVLNAFLEEKNQIHLYQLTYMLIYLPYLSNDGQEFLNEIVSFILMFLIDLNDLDGLKANIGQNIKPEIDLTTTVIDTMTNLEDYYNKSNNKAINKIKSFLASRLYKKQQKVKFTPEPLIVTVGNLHDIAYEPRPIYTHTFPNFSVCIKRGVNSDGLSIILKQYHSFSQDFDSTLIKNEIDIMTYLSNKISMFKYVARLYFTHIDNSQICIWMEDGGRSLMEYITELKSKKLTIPKDILERWFIELIECFAQMNNHAINHCDIKPHNILVNEKDMSLKVIDFNISRMTGEVQSTMSVTDILPIQGTEGYMAPELEQAQRDNLKECHYKAGKSDVFSLGLTFLQMITLDKIVGYNMTENNPILMNRVNSLNCDDWIKIILKNMLMIDRRKRMSFSKLLQFVQKNIPTGIQ